MVNHVYPFSLRHRKEENMPGKEIKGRSKRANYRHGGRAGFKDGSGKKQPIPREDTKEYKEWYKSKLPKGRGG